jgi:hypothetical protein
VTLTEAGDREEFSECVSRHGGYCSDSVPPVQRQGLSSAIE